MTIAPTPLVNEAAQGANYTNQTATSFQNAAYVESARGASSSLRQPVRPSGKINGLFASPTSFSDLTAAVDPTLTTTTTPDGSWAFGGIRAPGYYLVTFSKPGYNTQSYVVTVSSDGPAGHAAIGPISPGQRQRCRAPSSAPPARSATST